MRGGSISTRRVHDNLYLHDRNQQRNTHRLKRETTKHVASYISIQMLSPTVLQTIPYETRSNQIVNVKYGSPTGAIL